MENVHLKFIDNTWMKVVADPGILMELVDAVTFYAPNYKWHPKFRARVWDGKIRLLNSYTGKAYAGLAQIIKKKAESYGYKVTWDDEFYYDNVSEHELREFIASLKIPKKFEDRDYQFDTILKMIRSNRRTLLSPTSSGKSLMIYIIMRYYEKFGRGLVIVPRTGLVKQMAADFTDYGYKGVMHLSVDGLSKANNIPCDVVISTWQSINNGKNKMSKSWYKQFEYVFGDEAHGAKAAVLTNIMESMPHVKYRFGTTGTLDDEPLNETTIQGLFGPKYQAVTTKELMDAGYIANLQIKCLILKHPVKYAQLNKKNKYSEEVQFINQCEARNNFIKNLVKSLDGNKLVFFRIRKHGHELAQLLKSAGLTVFHIDGNVKTQEREDIRLGLENETNSVLVASLGTSAEGISINRLKHMIAASSSKSKIKVLQAIGRLLRLHPEYKKVILYDIVDDLSYLSYINYTLQHFSERLKMYDKEQFDYKIYNIGLNYE